MDKRDRVREALRGMPTLELERAVLEQEIDELEEAEEACRAFGIDAERAPALEDAREEGRARRCAEQAARAGAEDDGRELAVAEIPAEDPTPAVEAEGTEGAPPAATEGEGDAAAPRRARRRARRGRRKGEENAELGRRGEDAAARFLYRRGYDIVERNWTCAAGEADIIARDGDAVVFVEVKTRTSVEKGMPSEAVDARKRERYERIAALFLKDYDAVDVPVRFDVVSLLVISSDRALVRHHINAFAAG